MGMSFQTAQAGRGRVYDAIVVGSGIRRFALSAHARPKSGSTAGPGCAVAILVGQVGIGGHDFVVHILEMGISQQCLS